MPQFDSRAQAVWTTSICANVSSLRCVVICLCEWPNGAAESERAYVMSCSLLTRYAATIPIQTDRSRSDSPGGRCGASVIIGGK